MAPCIPKLWEAMDEKHNWAFALLGYVHVYAINGHSSVLDCVHGDGLILVLLDFGEMGLVYSEIDEGAVVEQREIGGGDGKQAINGIPLKTLEFSSSA